MVIRTLKGVSKYNGKLAHWFLGNERTRLIVQTVERYSLHSKEERHRLAQNSIKVAYEELKTSLDYQCENMTVN